MLRAFRALREVDEARNLTEFRNVVPAVLARLFACDRSNYNEFTIEPGRRNVLPNPIPTWWAKYRDVYLQHMEDHPVLYWARKGAIGESVTFQDETYRPSWYQSPLMQEYFRPLEVVDQLSSLISGGTDGLYVGVAVNRSHGWYLQEDKELLNLISPFLATRLRFLRTIETSAAATKRVIFPALPVFPKMTAREAEVLSWLAAGKRNGEIGLILCISERTVEKHVQNVFTKLGVETRTAAVAAYLAARAARGVPPE